MARLSAVSPTPLGKLGIVAGGGLLPQEIVEACQARGVPYEIFAIQGQCDEGWLSAQPHATAHLDQLSASLKSMRESGITHVTLAGYVTTPCLSSLNFKRLLSDPFALKLLARIYWCGLKENALLTEIINHFEKFGIQVLGTPEVAPSLVMPTGALGKVIPTENQLEMIQRGAEQARLLGLQDQGQAVLLTQDGILLREDHGGTATLMRRYAEIQNPQVDAVLVKTKKPQQTLKADLPTIGPDTVHQAKGAGLCGIALEAGAGLVLGRSQMVREADKAGIFIYGF